MPHRVFDHIEIRCPQLGGEVTFGYCRTLADGLPCSRALVCFELKFPVVAYFQRVLKAETYERIFNAPQPSRMDKFLNTISEAKERTDKS
jgi:hypothetical protein